jgi:hypothetical protein
VTQDKLQLLKELWTLNHGKALREYLDEQMKELTDVKNCKSWEDTLGRQHAERILNELFSLKDSSVVTRPPKQYE